MPVCELLLERDIRAPRFFSASAAARRYTLRRLLSVGALLAADTLAALIALSIAKTQVLGPEHNSPSIMWIAVVASTVAIHAILGLYGMYERRRRPAHMTAAVALTLGTLTAAQTLLGEVPLPAATLTAAIAIGLSVVLRLVYDAALDRVFGTNRHAKRVIYVASREPQGCPNALLPESRTGANRRIVPLGLLLPSEVEREAAQPTIKHLGALDDLAAAVEEFGPDEIVVLDDYLGPEQMDAVVAVCRHQRLGLKLPDTAPFCRQTSATISQVGDAPVFVSRLRQPPAVAWFIKRCIDLSLAFVLLILAAPLFAFIALTIKLTSAGPVFFVDQRVGLGQKVFPCYKFRKMCRDAADLQAQLEDLNEADGAIFKLREDPRVTGIGRLLRKTSLDELPQLLNVLRGEMSLVGPRPLPLRDNQLLDTAAKGRHVVLPGLTGLWQVSGRSDASFDDMMHLDYTYIDDWSLWLDLRILAGTFRAVVASRGAY